ncbi:TPR-like protein [Penicillium angulare]|uniref:TPR-like protein n=1 Tax=Penicillium angulare TaxID=116970 RepID=UPI002540FB37|nr:TPR-like protein [Penicillium angulare]KAJ5266997.1 TPR-like protein [Penicillium angulare]
MYQRALKGYMNFGPDDSLTLKAVSNLGALYLLENRYKKAEVMYQRVFQTHLRVSGPDEEEMTEAAQDLGQFYLENERWSEAEIFLTRAFKGYQTTSSSKEKTTWPIALDLGNVFWELNRPKDALGWYQQALMGFDQDLNVTEASRDSRVLEILITLNNVYSRLGDSAQALIHTRRALLICEKIEGPDSSQCKELARKVDKLEDLAYQYRGPEPISTQPTSTPSGVFKKPSLFTKLIIRGGQR